MLEFSLSLSPFPSLCMCVWLCTRVLSHAQYVQLCTLYLCCTLQHSHNFELLSIPADTKPWQLCSESNAHTVIFLESYSIIYTKDPSMSALKSILARGGYLWAPCSTCYWYPEAIRPQRQRFHFITQVFADPADPIHFTTWIMKWAAGKNKTSQTAWDPLQGFFWLFYTSTPSYKTAFMWGSTKEIESISHMCHCSYDIREKGYMKLPLLFTGVRQPTQ